VRELLDVYRLRHGAKISSLRLFFYMLFGYAAYVFSADSFSFLPMPIVINAAIILCGLLYASALNDYYDFLLLKEKNGISNFLARTNATNKYPFLLIWGPWAVSLVLFFVLLMYQVTVASLILLWAAFLLSFLYCAPPVRLKERRILNIIVPPIGLFLLFFEGFVLLAHPTQFGWSFAIIVFLFAWYLEFLHIVDDAQQKHEIKRMSISAGMFGLRAIAGTGFFVSLAMSFSYPVFLVSVGAWGVRLLTVFKIKPAEIIRARLSLRHSLWSLWDFALFALLGFYRLYAILI